jgi:hypothetical protein
LSIQRKIKKRKERMKKKSGEEVSNESKEKGGRKTERSEEVHGKIIKQKRKIGGKEE